MCRRSIVLYVCVLAWVLLFLSAVQAADPTLIGWWPFDEESGTIAYDASDYGNDGTLSENVSWVPDGGYHGGAVLYDGTNTAHVEISAAEMSATAGTVMIWGKISDPLVSQTQYFFGHTTQPSYNNRIQLYMDTDTTDLDLGLGGSHTARTGIATLDLETWYHLALTWDSGVYFVYVNGEEAATGSYSALTDIHTIAWIGNDGNPDSQGTEAFAGMLDEARLYNRAVSQDEVQTAMETGLEFTSASTPLPLDGATDVLRDITLSWTAGAFAATHDVYFGTSFDDVDAASADDPMGVLLRQGQTDVTCDIDGLLEFGTTYYWRVDEVNAAPDFTVFKGAVWSFTTEPFAYAVQDIIATTNAVSKDGQGPENTVNGSGLNENDEHSANQPEMWTAAAGDETPYIQFEFDRLYKMHEMLVWNHNLAFEMFLGIGLKDVTIETSTDGVEWTVLGDAVLAQAPGSPTYTPNSTVPLDGVAAKFVRLSINSAYGTSGQIGLSEVRFLYLPVHAREPQPVDGAADVDVAATLSWRPGREAVTHELYLGADPNALDMVGTSTEVGYDPGSLDFGATYYWQVVEVNEAEATPAWDSDLWSFSTMEYAQLDGFEDYDDDPDAGTTIWQTWIDGLDDADNGRSIVGYDKSPFAEQAIVYNGAQSMPLEYRNADSPYFSEAERTWATGQDWATGSPEVLRFYVRGSSFDLYERSADSFIVGAAGADIWGTADEFRFLYKQLTGDGSIVARIDGLDETDAWAKACVMIRETLDAGSVNAMSYVTPDGRAGWQSRATTDGDTVSTRSDAGTITVPHWIRITREGNLFTAEHSADGVTWEPMIEQENPAEESFGEVTMAQTVYIGIGFTSHAADVLGQAEFSNVATEGNVTGAWQLADIGIDHPVGTNGADMLYVAVEDTGGNRETVNIGVAPLGYGSWRPVDVPLETFSSAGVNLASVKKLAIGVGDPSAPMNGQGQIFIDDVSYGTPVE